ncbi:DUF6701 domain-containing protein [Aliivibrio sifiae]|uniref:DUF6701 domain-containing protein n=1 Tax=Aliivibrio sifiae TaxID=566293 RepID=UPI003D0A75B1
MVIAVYIKRLLLLNFLFIVFISHANANNNFEFGVLNNQNCIDQSCTISFENTYTSPLVFLLSSFDAANYTTDVSSTLFLESVSSTNATIRQKTRVYEQSEQIQMLSIQYVVVEEGKIVLDPTQPTMLAETGVISGAAYIGKKVKHKHKKWLNVDFKSPFSKPPIVFTQIQGLSQTNVWATTSNRNVSPQGFDTTLELGRSSIMPANDQPEKIAYLAIQEFSGITDRGASFVVGKKENVNQKKRKGDDGGALDALARSCRNNTISLPSSFDSNYTVLISKQTRQGADGGWLRLCEGQQNNELSFMLDEDHITREHGALETVGYLAFENKNDSFDMCEYFPSAAQTWFDGGGSKVQLIVDGEKGGNRSYIETPSRKVGFPSGSMNLKSGNTCESSNGGDCIADPSLMVSKLSMTTEFTGVDGVINGLSDITISPGHYTAINLMGGNAFDYIQVNVEPGVYWVNQFNATGFAEIHFSNIEKTIIHVQNWNDPGNVIYNHEAKPDNLLIAAHGINANILMAGSNLLKAHLYSENNIALNGSVSVYGAVTAKTLKLFSNSRIIGQSECITPSNDVQLVISPISGKGLACDGIKIDFSLVDSNGDVVEAKGQNLQVTSNSVVTGDRNSACWSEDGNITTPECNHTDDSRFDATFPSSGPAIVTRFIHSKFLNSYNVSASVSSENLTTTEGPYEFIAKAISIVPSEGVDGSNSNQVAGRPFPFRLKVRGKENGNGNQLNCKIIKDDIDLNVNFSHSKQPISSSKNLEISYNNGRWETANNNILISFEDGVAGGDENRADGTLLAKFDDAGIINLTARVAIQGDDFTTSEQFYFRPFTAALCDSSSALPSYIDEESGAYLASGTDFNAYLKAVNWIKSLDSGAYGDGVPDRSAPSLVCSKAVTSSYITHSGGSAKLNLSSQLSYPVSGVVGVIIADGQLITNFNKDITNSNQNSPTIMNWNEVGALKFDVFQNNYFNRTGFNIPSTTSNVGRFYPAYFSITNTLWDYPENQGSSEGTYSYMAQPFDDVNFEVTAYSDNDSIVANYGLFDTNLKASFLLTGGYNNRLNIASSDLDNTHWSNATWETPDLSNSVIWSRESASMLAGNVTTTVDGPFNEGGNSITTALSLAISGVDPVSFDKNKEAVLEQELLSQPSTRYGRMVLNSVGTTINQDVNIPLRVEYWNRSRFVVSDTDNKANFDGDKYCKQIIWPNPTDLSPSKLVGSGGVDKGINQADLNADPDGHALREQVRFWLRLAAESPQKGESNVNCQGLLGSNDEQPWLQYNWRGQGDEDPSTVVTFGIYRGNDRIIFRGESNIIGTSN